MVLDTIKTRQASLSLNGFKNIPQKECPSGVQRKVQIVRGERNKPVLITTFYIGNSNED